MLKQVGLDTAAADRAADLSGLGYTEACARSARRRALDADEGGQSYGFFSPLPSVQIGEDLIHGVASMV